MKNNGRFFSGFSDFKYITVHFQLIFSARRFYIFPQFSTSSNFSEYKMNEGMPKWGRTGVIPKMKDLISL